MPTPTWPSCSMRSQWKTVGAFRTVIALTTDGGTLTFEGICNGTIAAERSGAKGFGYDPVFVPEGGDITFADMNAAAKNAISHRGRAVRAMVGELKARG